MSIRSAIRNVINRIRRPSSVTAAQRAAVRRSPVCAACGSTLGLQGHHIQPYNKFPELAASPDNFIVMCEVGLECHLHIGHAGNFKMFNPDVVVDAAMFRQANDARRRVILDGCKAKRQVDGP